MSHPYSSKMQGGKIAQKRYGKFADGGKVEPQPSDLYSPSDLKTVSSPKNMGASTKEK